MPKVQGIYRRKMVILLDHSGNRVIAERDYESPVRTSDNNLGNHTKSIKLRGKNVHK